ncbi:uncharacterized protein LOC133373968 [Rhineura floridana]|uniref:uncharacterized protein LOC133373968 n=1 Tax=Rhineura floridana TaxID=261503 RepID=UPI002AC7F8A4|nr:uncharacterized protein LOC133373968 [Rhineura floridana]
MTSAPLSPSTAISSAHACLNTEARKFEFPVGAMELAEVRDVSLLFMLVEQEREVKEDELLPIIWKKSRKEPHGRNKRIPRGPPHKRPPYFKELYGLWKEGGRPSWEDRRPAARPTNDPLSSEEDNVVEEEPEAGSSQAEPPRPMEDEPVRVAHVATQTTMLPQSTQTTSLEDLMARMEIMDGKVNTQGRQFEEHRKSTQDTIRKMETLWIPGLHHRLRAVEAGQGAAKLSGQASDQR